MYDNLRLYYLEQMGITPWVHQNNFLEAKNKKTLLLIVTPKLNNKEQNLLKNIISFLGVQDKQFLHLQIEHALKPLNIEATYTLSFGLKEQYTCIADRGELNHLLKNPLAKKKLFHSLIPLKNQLTL